MRLRTPCTVSHRMHGDLQPWHPPWRHGWHVAPGPLSASHNSSPPALYGTTATRPYG